MRVWIKDAEVLADRFVFEIAKLPLGGAAEELHDAVSVDENHRIRDSLQDRTKVAFPGSQGFFDLLLIVNIDHGPAELTAPPVFVPYAPPAKANQTEQGAPS